MSDNSARNVLEFYFLSAKLKDVIAKCKAANMPNDTINNAIKKASGSNESYEEITYEGYGTNGVAVIVNAATDNKNRTAADVRHIFDKFGGNFISKNVGYLFAFKEEAGIHARGDSKLSSLFITEDGGNTWNSISVQSAPSISLSEDIIFSKMNSDYIIDKTYNSDVILEDIREVQLKLVSFCILDDLLKFNYSLLISLPKKGALPRKRTFHNLLNYFSSFPRNSFILGFSELNTSSGVPSSTITPPFNTTILSASRMVDRRWAMISEVRFFISATIAC